MQFKKTLQETYKNLKEAAAIMEDGQRRKKFQHKIVHDFSEKKCIAILNSKKRKINTL